MKIAYLMNGVIGGLSGKNFEYKNIDLRPLIVEYTARTHKFLRKDNIDIDYFIFTWEPLLAEEYIKHYAPKGLMVSDQMHFIVPAHFKHQENNPRVQAHYSRWYGANQVMDLCNEYAAKTNTQYDLVINGRLDLCFHNQLNLDLLDANKFHIARLIDNPGFGWPDKLPELVDHIFATNLNSMNDFLNLYNELEEFTKPKYSTWNVISNHFLSAHKLKSMNILNKEIVSKTFSAADSKCIYNKTDYHIFRYEGLNETQLKQKLGYEL